MGVQVNSYFKSKYTGAQIENMLDAFGNTAAAYETSTAYSVGDLVLYNNALYVCTGATTGAFDPSKWQQTTLAEIFANLGATYSDPNNDGNVVVGVDSTVGEKILRSLTFPGLTNRYYLPFAQYIRTQLANDPASASFDVEIPDAEEAPMHSTVIKGKTVAVNQLVKDGNFPSMTNWNAYSSTANVSGNIATVTASAQGGGLYQLTQTVKDHIYFISVDMKTTTATNQVGVSFAGMHFCEATTNWQTVAFIATATSTTSYYFYPVRDQRTSGWDDVQCRNVIYKDLTAEGYTDTETTDVSTFKTAFLKRMGYPLPTYIPYDNGSLANVNGAYRVRGRNLWANGDVSKGANTYQSITLTNPLKAGTYTVSLKATSATGQVRLSFRLSSAVTVDLVADGSRKSSTFNLSGDCYTVYFYGQWSSSAQNAASLFDVQIEDGTTAHDFEPFYDGGTIDCSDAPLNGVGTAQDEKDFATGARTTRMQIDDMGDLTWYKNNTWGFYATPSHVAKNFTNGQIGNGVCSAYPTGEGKGAPDTGTFVVYGDYIRIGDTSFADADAFKTAMTGQKVCYEMLTPVVSTETPQPLTTQYGYNVLEPTSGGVQSAEVNLTYYENIAGYIDKKIGA